MDFSQLHRQELIRLTYALAPDEGSHPTAVPGLYLNRANRKSGPVYTLMNPSLCVILQGKKEVFLQDRCFVYEPSDYLVASMDLPVSAYVTDASPDEPYLSIKLEFTSAQIIDALQGYRQSTASKKCTAVQLSQSTSLSASASDVPSDSASPKTLYVNKLTPALFDALYRIVRLTETPDTIDLLYPLIMKEILFHLIRDHNGTILESIVSEGTQMNRINSIIQLLIHEFNQPFKIEELAERVNMSPSSFHRCFRSATTMSPLQFQKQVRLQNARRLLLTQTATISDAAFRVGYESPSQFSREYRRLFGYSPSEELRRLTAL